MREPSATITALYRGRREPMRIPAPSEPCPMALAAELADRVHWAAWNTKEAARRKIVEGRWR